MSNILTIAYTAEGSTDQRFLQNIIRKTFEEVALNGKGLIEVYEPVFIKFDRKKGFTEDVLNLSVQAFKIGINVFCIHVDADDATDQEVWGNRIMPAFAAVTQTDKLNVCKNLVAIVPVQMSEAWMLADKNLLKEEIGTNLSNQDLKLTQFPERVANPKQVIETAITIAQGDLPRKQKRLTIADLYQPIGQKIAIERLKTLASYQKFKRYVEDALRKLNYLE